MSRSAAASLAALCTAVLLTGGCTTSGAAVPCSVTSPTDKAVPPGVSEESYGPVLGRGTLWVGAWWADQQVLDQVRAQRPRLAKYPSFTVRDGEVTGVLGAPDVRVERLDARGQGSGSTGGYATAIQDGTGAHIHWWPTIVTFSSSGCWQVTETLADTRITYVVKV